MPPVTAIKKYNYERSAYRWFMSRHMQKFEEMGLTTRTLERAPAARQAFFQSGWVGAYKLVQRAEKGYERTPFFDCIIERGLHSNTRFNISHIQKEEKEALGIAQLSSTGKYYLTQFGPDLHQQAPCRPKKIECEAQKMLWKVIVEQVGDELSRGAASWKITKNPVRPGEGGRGSVTQLVIEISDAGCPVKQEEGEGEGEWERPERPAPTGKRSVQKARPSVQSERPKKRVKAEPSSILRAARRDSPVAHPVTPPPTVPARVPSSNPYAHAPPMHYKELRMGRNEGFMGSLELPPDPMIYNLPYPSAHFGQYQMPPYEPAPPDHCHALKEGAFWWKRDLPPAIPHPQSHSAGAFAASLDAMLGDLDMSVLDALF